MLVRIKDKTLVFKSENIQYGIQYANSRSIGGSLGSTNASIEFTFDIVAHPEYKTFLNDILSHQKNPTFTNPFYKIDISTQKYQGFGCLIKMMDTSDDQISISFTCDSFTEVTTQEIRDRILNQLLD